MPSSAAVVVTIRARGVWRVRLIFWLLLLARRVGIIRHDDHAVVIAEWLALRVLRLDIRQGQHWRPIRMKRRRAR